MFGPASYLALLTLCAGAVLVEPAVATAAAAKPPEYTLSVVEGETTLPEYPIVQTYGKVEPKAQVAVSITRNGTVVAKSSTSEGESGMSQVPQVGDVVSLESPVGNVVGAFVYDGLPSIDPTVCAGSTNFSGQNSSGQTVKGGYFTETLHPDPYGAYTEQTNSGRAQVTILSGTSFGGSFLSPLATGQTVYALESLETPLAGGAVFKYTSQNDRPVGACPAPPPPPPSPPPPPALQGAIFKFAKTTIQRFLKSGLMDEVTINQPGTVVQDLYLQDGKLPAFAASKKRKGKHHRKVVPPAQLVARGSTTAKSAGTVSVSIKVTAQGRRLLRHRDKVQLVLVTTLQSTSGAKLNLARRTITLKR
jgi:hypothetical protein